jgi:uncharacterized OB-fold protein
MPPGAAIAPGLFHRVDDGGVVLLGHRCHVCGTPGFPRRDTCGTCGSEAPDEVELGRSGGVLTGWTQVTAAPPGYEGVVPYGFGIVDLDDGIRVLGRLLGDVAAFEHGQRMVCVTEQVAHDDDGSPLLVWAFAPVPGDEP